MSGVYFIIAIVLFVFSSVGHITDSTAKAMGWGFLVLIARIAAVVFFIMGIVCLFS